MADIMRVETWDLACENAAIFPADGDGGVAERTISPRLAPSVQLGSDRLICGVAQRPGT